jgi:hypothetical protein
MYIVGQYFLGRRMRELFRWNGAVAWIGRGAKAEG